MPEFSKVFLVIIPLVCIMLLVEGRDLRDIVLPNKWYKEPNQSQAPAHWTHSSFNPGLEIATHWSPMQPNNISDLILRTIHHWVTHLGFFCGPFNFKGKQHIYNITWRWKIWFIWTDKTKQPQDSSIPTGLLSLIQLLCTLNNAYLKSTHAFALL